VKKYTIIVEQVGDHWEARFDGDSKVVTGGDTASAALSAIAAYMKDERYIVEQINKAARDQERQEQVEAFLDKPEGPINPAMAAFKRCKLCSANHTGDICPFCALKA
jgi:hypothetical protein